MECMLKNEHKLPQMRGHTSPKLEFATGKSEWQEI